MVACPERIEYTSCVYWWYGSGIPGQQLPTRVRRHDSETFTFGGKFPTDCTLHPLFNTRRPGVPCRRCTRLEHSSALKIHNSSLNTTHSARNLGFIFDEHLTFSDQISAVSKACYYHIRQLRCTVLTLIDPTTACTTATSIVHSKLDYCNSLYYSLSKS